VGVLFSLTGADQRKNLAEFVRLFRHDTIQCSGCRSPVSVDAALCYKCGTRLVRKRTFFRNIINTILSGDADPEKR
jgi:hypothetical protein